jgi:plastocyanin
MKKAKKKVRVTARRVSRGSTSHSHHHTEHNNFLIILGGGFIVIVLLFVFMNGTQVGKSRALYQEAQTYAADVVATEQTITVNDQGFLPKILTVNKGTKVTWVNRDTVPHSATADDGTFDTGLFAENKSGSYTFTQEGTYTYHSEGRPDATATIVVK